MFLYILKKKKVNFYYITFRDIKLSTVNVLYNHRRLSWGAKLIDTIMHSCFSLETQSVECLWL